MILVAQFPARQPLSQLTRKGVEVFDAVAGQIDSEKDELRVACGGRRRQSNEVLPIIKPGLERLGFKLKVPVRCGTIKFELDAWHQDARVVIEVEGGRGVENNNFLKDLFKACVMDNVDGLIIAVRKVYCGGNQRSRPFEEVCNFLNALYTCVNYVRLNLVLPLNWVFVVGY